MMNLATYTIHSSICFCCYVCAYRQVKPNEAAEMALFVANGSEPVTVLEASAWAMQDSWNATVGSLLA